MGIQEECNQLQSILSQVLDSLAEAKTRANQLLDCPISEHNREINSILDICHEGLSSLRESLTQIELIQSLTGSTSGSETSNERGKFLEKVKDRVEKVVTVTSAAGAILSGIVPNPIPTDIDTLKPLSSQEYRIHPDRVGYLGSEDQLNEAYTQARIDEVQRRQEELDKSVIALNLPKTSGSPNPNSQR